MKKHLGSAIMIVALVIILSNLINKSDRKTKNVDTVKVDHKYEYGILVDSLIVIKGVVEKNQTLGEILYANHIDHTQIAEVVNKSKGIFDVRRVNAGKEYTVICSNDSIQKALYFIYQEDFMNYVVMETANNINVYRGKKEVLTKYNNAQGEITSSLWIAIEEQGLSPKIASELSTIYAWTIDFFKIQKGDAFKVYYENRYVDDKYIGIGRILAAEFTHNNEVFYAFYYKENKKYGEYFDISGKTLRKAFLKAPVDYKRISSKYSRNRKHPVTGRWKGHFGTDYAADRGTPIWSTANGTVVAASYTKNNGNYVKVRHNSTYSTQYLHMSKIKKGIKKGVYVDQGDIIGYVGSTGLATGPHVCYRFWKNGRQVDPYKQKLPPGDPIKEENLEDFTFAKDSLLKILLAEKE